MPYDDPDATDPMTLHGVVLETDSAEANRDMACCFIEEYLRLGFDRVRLLKLFQTKGYAGPYMAYCELGEETIMKLIDEYASRWGPRQNLGPIDRDPHGGIPLPVLGQQEVL